MDGFPGVSLFLKCSQSVCKPPIFTLVYFFFHCKAHNRRILPIRSQSIEITITIIIILIIIVIIIIQECVVFPDPFPAFSAFSSIKSRNLGFLLGDYVEIQSGVSEQDFERLNFFWPFRNHHRIYRCKTKTNK